MGSGVDPSKQLTTFDMPEIPSIVAIPLGDPISAVSRNPTVVIESHKRNRTLPLAGLLMLQCGDAITLHGPDILSTLLYNFSDPVVSQIQNSMIQQVGSSPLKRCNWVSRTR